jgi:hypothetical protein
LFLAENGGTPSTARGGKTFGRSAKKKQSPPYLIAHPCKIAVPTHLILFVFT